MVTVILAAGVLAALPPSVTERDTRPVSVRSAPAPAADEVDAGDLSFVLDAEREKIRVRVLVASIRDGQPGQLDGLSTALHDPMIGGMFEGSDMLRYDPATSRFWLERELPLKSEGFDAEVEDLVDLASRWRTDWFGQVWRIVIGEDEAPSTKRVRAGR